jgi:acyl carrier protein
MGVTPKFIVTKNSKIAITKKKRRSEMKDVKGTIVRIIAEYLDKDETEISTSSTFSEIGLDSLDIMELVMQMQEELDCKIELSQEITTIDKLAEQIETQAVA